MSELSYYFVDVQWPPSVDPSDSDYSVNLTLMESLVGTLVKYDDAGAYAPFLAEEWQVSADRLCWKFCLRPGLRDEHSQPFTATQYVESLCSLLRINFKGKVPPTFDRLRGWNDYWSGRRDDIEGLRAPDDHTVVFEFERAPDGFLDYLAMPYFGYYAPSDFTSKGWNAHTHITSSGPYKLVKWTTDEIGLEVRPDCFSVVPSAARKITFRRRSFEDALRLAGPWSIIQKNLDAPASIPDKFRLIRSTPTALVFAALSPFRDNLFRDPSNRLVFLQRVRVAQSVIRLESTISTVAHTFFHQEKPCESGLTAAEPRFDKSVFKDPLKVVITAGVTGKARDHTLQVLSRVFDPEGIPYEIVPLENSFPDWREKASSNRFYDVRVGCVEIGSHPENWVIRMMFCSTLGISFPDPSGRMRALTDKAPPEWTPATLAAYTAKFNRILAEDAAVVPLCHVGRTWLFSNDIDVSRVSPTMAVPRFDTLPLR